MQAAGGQTVAGKRIGDELVAYKRSVPLEDKHRWVAKAATALQEQLEEPVQYRMLQKIATEVIKEPLLHWVPNCPEPQMEEVSLHVQREKQGLSIVTSVFIDFVAVSDRYIGVVQLRPNWRAVESADHLIQFYRDSLQEMVRNSAASLAQRLTPEGILDPTKRYWDTSVLERLAQRTLHEDAELQGQIQKIQAAWSDAYRDRIARARRLPGFAPAQIISLEAGFEIEYQDRSHCQVTLRALLEGGLYWQGKAAFPVGQCPFYTTRKAQQAYLQPAIRESVASLLTEAVPVPLICTAPSLDALPGMPPGLSTLLKTGKSSLGIVSVSWERKGYPTGLVFWQPGKDRGKIRYPKEPGDHCNLENSYVLPLKVENLQAPAVPLCQIQRLPVDLLGWWHLAEALQQALQAELQGREWKLPELDAAAAIAVTIEAGGTYPAVSYGPRYVPQHRWERVTFASKQKYTGEGLQEALQQLVKEICRMIRREDNLGVQQLQVLNGLGADALSVLNYVAEHPGAQIEMMADALGMDEDEVLRVLNQLRRTLVPAGNGETPVIDCQYDYNGFTRQLAFSLDGVNPDLVKLAGRGHSGGEQS